MPTTDAGDNGAISEILFYSQATCNNEQKARGNMPKSMKVKVSRGVDGLYVIQQPRLTVPETDTFLPP